MTSAAQRIANQQNATRSTGPRTTAGKTASSHNAVTHGLTGQGVTLPDEDPQAWVDLRDALVQHFAPVDPIEEQHVERIASCTWRLRRLERIETAVLQYQLCDQRARDAHRSAAAVERAAPFSLTEEHMKALTTTVIDQSRHTAALVRAAQAERDRDAVPLAAAFIADAAHGHALAKLSRYEVAIERSRYQAQHELERLQMARRHRATSAPTVIEVDRPGRK